MKTLTKKLDSIVKMLHGDIHPNKIKNSNNLLLALLDNSTTSQIDLILNKMKYFGPVGPKELKELICDRLFYISHPSISSLECSINLNISTRIDKNLFFETTTKEILKLADFNPKQIEIRSKYYTILFKDIAALKLLNIIFKDNTNHVLYPIYLKWIGKFEWLKY